MNTVSLKKSTSIRLDRELYNYIEKLAKKENRSINNYIETLLAGATRFHEPNAEKKRAIAEARKERPILKRYSNSKDLLDELE